MQMMRRVEANADVLRAAELAMKLECGELAIEEFIAALHDIIAHRTATGSSRSSRSAGELESLYDQLKAYPLDQWGKQFTETHLTMSVQHWRLLQVVPQMPQDYPDFGTCPRESEDGATWYADCSAGCRWYITFPAPLGYDWGCCTNPRSHRCGLLTFEHQGCPQFEFDPRIDAEFERLAAEQAERFPIDHPALADKIEALRQRRQQRANASSEEAAADDATGGPTASETNRQP